MIAIIDYGAGNLFSVKNALDYIGADSVITSKAEDLKRADKLILPGVGALPNAMEKLELTGLVEIIKREVSAEYADSRGKIYEGKPLLGICVGMQMLFKKGFEFRETECLGLIDGEVVFMEDAREAGLKIPHMGWNDVNMINQCPLADGIQKEDRLYYVHSYKAVTEDSNISFYSEYGGKVPGLVFRGNVFGTQFHPEKSGTPGLKILKNFCEL